MLQLPSSQDLQDTLLEIVLDDLRPSITSYLRAYSGIIFAPYTGFNMDKVQIKRPLFVRDRHSNFGGYLGDMMYLSPNNRSVPLSIELKNLKCLSGIYKETNYDHVEVQIDHERARHEPKETGTYRALCEIDPANPEHLALRQLLIDTYIVALKWMEKYGKKGEGVFARNYELREKNLRDILTLEHLPSQLLCPVIHQGTETDGIYVPLAADLPQFLDLTIRIDRSNLLCYTPIQESDIVQTTKMLSAIIRPQVVISKDNFISLEVSKLVCGESYTSEELAAGIDSHAYLSWHIPFNPYYEPTDEELRR